MSCRNPEYLAELRSFLVSCIENGTEKATLQHVLFPHIQEFETLLTIQHKDASARTEVESGKINLNGTEYSVNKDFIDTTLRLADSLDLNERIAAEYVFSATENSVRFDREPFECALYLYQTNRCILLDILRIIMASATDETLNLDTREALHGFVSRLISDDGNAFTARCILLMRDVQNQSLTLEVTDRRNALFGATTSSVDASRISACLLEQHESISIFLGLFCHLRPDVNNYLNDIIKSLKEADTWSIYVSHQILVLMLGIQALSLAEESQTSFVQYDLIDLATAFRSMMQTTGIRLTDDWRCPPICSTIQIILATEMNSICKEHDEFASSFNYDDEISVMAHQAIEHNVFQHMITHSLFVHQEVSTAHEYRFFFTRDAFTHYRTSVEATKSNLVASTLLECYRVFIQNFIINLADILKEIHLKTEDSFAMQELSDTAFSEEEYHQEDLFYGVIYTAFSAGEDVGRVFWDDTESDLYGFLAWASHASVPSTIYAYFKMVGALCKGSFCSGAGKEFFDQGDLNLPASRSAPSPTISWHFIFDSLRYYVRHLDRKNGPNNYSDPLEIDFHNALILEAYLSSIYAIASTLPEVSNIDALITKYDASTILFQLMVCRLPPELYCAILRVLASFARSPSQKNALWQLLDGWLGAKNIEAQSTALTATMLRRKPHEHRSLFSLAIFGALSWDVSVCLIDLLTALIHSKNLSPGDAAVPQIPGDVSRHHGIVDYVDFVYNSLLSAQKQEEHTVLERLRLSSACTRFMVQALLGLELDLIHLVRSGIASKHTNVTAKALPQLLESNPGSRLLSLLSRPVGKDPLVAIVRNHDAADPSIKERLLPVVSTAIDVLDLTLERADMFSEFVLPLLHTTAMNTVDLSEAICTDTELFLHLCLLGGGDDVNSASSAMKLLVDIGQKLTERTSRLNLTALNSVDQSKSVLLGLINLVEQRDSESTKRIGLLLDFIINDLERSSTGCFLSVAHFLLGFATPTNKILSEGSDSGEIASGHSLLHSLLSLLLMEDSSKLPADLSITDIRVRSKVTRILRLLYEDESARSIVIPILRENEIFSELLAHPQSLSARLLNHSSDSDICSRIDRTLETIVCQRSDALRYCSTELLVCRNADSLSFLKDYAAFLVSADGQAGKFNVLLLDYLDALQLDVTLPSSGRTWQLLDPAPFSANILLASKQSIRQLQIALDLNYSVLKSTSDTAARESLQKEYSDLQDHLARTIEKADLRKALLLYMRQWTSLMTIMFEVLEKCSHAGRSLVAYEISQHLLNRLPDVQERDPNLADIVAEAASTAVTWSTKSTMANTDLYLQFFKKILSCLQCPASTYVQREFLYNSGYFCLQTIAKDREILSVQSQLFASSRSGIERSLVMICQDIMIKEEVLKLSACVYLDLLLQVCEDMANPWLTMSMIRANLLDRVLHHFEVMIQAADSSKEILDAMFGIVLRLAMTRPGAREIATKPTLLSTMASQYFRLEDGQEDATDTLRLLSVYVSCGLSLGPQMNRKLLSSFSREWQEKLEAHARRVQKARNKDATSFQAMLDVMRELIRGSGS